MVAHGRLSICLGLAFMLAWSAHVRASTIRAASSNGTRGMHTVESASPMTGNELVLGVAGRFGSTRSFLAPNDQSQHWGVRGTIAWAPIPYLATFAAYNISDYRNDTVSPEPLRTFGNPELGLKGVYPVGDVWGLGLGSSVLLPTALDGAGLAANALTWTTYLAATAWPVAWLEIALNLGYVMDRSRFLSEATLTGAERFAANVYPADRVLAALGVQAHLDVATDAVLVPFVEVSAGFVTKGVTAKSQPSTVALGTKLIALDGLLDVSVGTTLRMTGAPSANLAAAGVAPWQVFANVATHLGENIWGEEPAVAGPVACVIDEDCVGTAGDKCIEGVCTVVKVEVKEVVTVQQTKEETFRVAGIVIDKTSQRPIDNAVIRISGYEDSPLAVDPKTGSYVSFPIPTGDGLIEISVQSDTHQPVKKTVARGKPDELLNVDLEMLRVGAIEDGIIRGTLLDGRTGKPIRGKIFIPALKKPILVRKNGAFQIKVEPGRYEVLISSRRYATQRKEILVRPGDVIILNVDMQRD